MKLLYQRQLTGTPLETLCGSFEELEDVSERTREFARTLARGVEAHREEIDARIKESLTGWDFGRLAAVDLQILRVAAYELLHCDDIPANVSIDEAIELSREFASGESSKFVNGVLGALCVKHAAHKVETRSGA